MSSEKNDVLFGDFSGDEVDQLCVNNPKGPVQFSPPPETPINLSGKSLTGNHGNIGNHGNSDISSPVFSFPLTNDDQPEIQFGSLNTPTPLFTNDNQSKVLNINANEFVPSNRVVIKRESEETVPSNQATSIQHSTHPPFPMYYPYYPQWVPDPRFMQSAAFFPHFGPHGYRFPYPNPPPHPMSVTPQVAVVAPYRTTGDIRPPMRISEEKLRGNEYSIPDTPKYNVIPISPNSLPSPPSTHGDSGIDLGQSKSISPPLTLVTQQQPLSVRPSSVNETIHCTSVDNKTPPIDNKDTGSNVTTPTQLEVSESDRNDDVSSTVLLNSTPVINNNNNNIQTVIGSNSETTPTKQLDDTPTNKVIMSNESSPVKPIKKKDKQKDKNPSIKTIPTNIELKPLNISKSKTIKASPTISKNSTNVTKNCSDNKKTTTNGIKEVAVPPVSVVKTTDTHAEATTTHPETSLIVPTPTKGMKSWASVVGVNDNNQHKTKGQKVTPTEVIPDITTLIINTSNKEEGPPCVTEGAKQRLKLLGDQVKSCSIIQDSSLLSVVPRGLRNNGNLCYIHAPLQALINCPPFYHLFTNIKLPSSQSAKDQSLTVATDTMIQFVNQFRVYPRDQHEDNKNGHKKKKSPLLYEDPFWPDFIYEMLTKAKSRLSVSGRQEDAEEFLCWLLSKLHDEMVSAVQAVDPAHFNEPNEENEKEEQYDDEGEWEEVGPRNKSTITRRASCEDSPISKLFGGKLQSTLHRQGMKETITIEPFFSLQLDVQSNDIHSIKDALEMLCVKENVSLSGKDKEAITGATRRITIADLPQCLILHIKRFYYDGTTTQKIHKAIGYDQNLEIPKDLIAVTSRGKITHSQRTYKLWAVICHQGKTVNKGHYICDVYHTATCSWIRVNDNYVKMIPADFVFNPSGAPHQHVPYLLFYKQCDSRRM